MNAKHNEENIAEELISIIECFHFSEKQGHFITDNAMNNDHAIPIISQRYSFDIDKRHI